MVTVFLVCRLVLTLRWPVLCACPWHLHCPSDILFPAKALLRDAYPPGNKTPPFAKTMCRVSFLMQFAVVAYGSRHPTFCALAIIWALLTGFSRAVMGRHYICDVLAGLLAGTCTTALVTQVRLITGFRCP